MTDTSVTYELQPGESLKGDCAWYEVERRLGQGGRGETFLAKITRVTDAGGRSGAARLEVGMRVVIKTPRLERDRDYYQLRSFVGAVNTALDEELAALELLTGRVSCVAEPIDDGKRRIDIPGHPRLGPRFIVQEYIEGTRLDHYLEAKFAKPPAEFLGIDEAGEWFNIARLLASALKEIHERGVCHRDIWPENIIFRNTQPEQLVFIDFGESSFRQSTEVVSVGIPARPHAYMAPECRDRTRFPTRRGDIYSLGAVFYYMATGLRPPLELPSNIEEQKEVLAREVTARNDVLVADNWGVLDIVCRCLRVDRSNRTRNAADLLSEMATFDRRQHAADPAEVLERITAQLADFPPTGNTVFRRMVSLSLSEIEDRLRDMREGIVDLSGDHEQLVSGAAGYLSILTEGDQYLEVSIPEFWNTENMGVRGRYLSMNRIVAQRRVWVKRVFLLSPWNEDDAAVKNILVRQLEASEGVPHLQIRVLRMASKEMVDQETRRGTHCGRWIKGDEVIRLTPVYDDTGVITTLRFRRREESVRVALRGFGHFFEGHGATPLREWLGARLT